MDDVSVTEPYQIYTAPWSNEIILMDDTGFDELRLLDDARIERKAGTTLLFTKLLPKGSRAEIYVDGYGHTLKVTVA